MAQGVAELKTMAQSSTQASSHQFATQTWNDQTEWEEREMPQR